MGFKIIKEQQQQQKYCDYVQNKFDIAQAYGARYELSDEDIRIQKLYDDNTLKPVEKVRSIARVKKIEDGQECLVVSKEVVFVDKLTGMYRDRYTVRDGLVELPLKVTNEDGVTETSQVKLEYDIPFSKSKVKEYVRKAGDRGVQLRFYDGPETSNRIPHKTQVVGNLQYFTNATWEELLLGKEMGLVSSRVNRLDEVRESVPEQERELYYKEEGAESPVTHEETNKIEESNTTIIEQQGEKGTEIIKNEVVEQKQIQKPGGIVKLKVPNPTNKKN